MIHKLLFRIWDPQVGQFVSSGAQFNNTTMTLDVVPGMVLEQHIEQTDIDKKKIFVGDVLKSTHTHYLQVIATRYGWAIRFIDQGIVYIEPITDDILDDDLKIVGNIHQNKDMIGIRELLKNMKKAPK